MPRPQGAKDKDMRIQRKIMTKVLYEKFKNKEFTVREVMETLGYTKSGAWLFMKELLERNLVTAEVKDAKQEYYQTIRKDGKTQKIKRTRKKKVTFFRFIPERLAEVGII